ncbi:voltage-gated shaker-like K+ channel, subunit [Mollisia scopiformis]|uniref:Voltage-gated shaker-like K+ channel, subunit n=1 Tax=Mollisia scopiformis TaxID=149040 RepID=A0A132BDT0_MOLSC|nr:voltage-gated shaker-like K+ channel, subunit [Mollisia scopiformis]KUJ10541.1 voltage-gated shaker-like K+ channel, subunit [Mollisia scopiformis]
MAARSLLHRHRQLAPTAAVYVSPLCLGGMGFGEAWASRMGACPKPQVFAILDHFYEKGGNFIDTANAYQNEESEQWIGEWMSLRGNRDEMVIATKYTGAYQNYKGANILKTNYGGNGSKSLKLSLEASLKKLQTSYIDLFYVHWFDFSTSIPELMLALNDLITSGKVLYLGVSDSPAWVAAKANQYARDHGLRQFSVYQGLWNAATRDFEREIVPMCRDEGMGILAYGTLGKGMFQSEEAFKEREKENPGRKMLPPSEVEKKASKVLEVVAERKQSTIQAVAMQYIMHKAPYVFPLIGGRKVEHLQGNIEALGLALDDKDMEEIDVAYGFEHGFPHEFLSGDHFSHGAPSKMAAGPQDVWLTKMLGAIDFVEPLKAITPSAEKVETDKKAQEAVQEGLKFTKEKK